MRLTNLFLALVATTTQACSTAPRTAARRVNAMPIDDVLPETTDAFLPDGRSAPQLLRVPYTSVVTKSERDYLVYLPAGYETQPDRRWPVIVFLHGDGERGDGKGELDLTMKHGPLHEAWEKRRDLPFVMVSPQLPKHRTFIDLGLPAEAVEFPGGDFSIERSPHGISASWGAMGPPRGWFVVEKDVMSMVDAALANYRVDAKRVYLTGLSYGGYGTWHFAQRFPTRFAAFAPVCGAGDVAGLQALAKAQAPVWAAHGGRDSVVLAEWQLATVQALADAGHKTVRFTVHEDLAHNVWERVYGGWDLYLWLLQQSRSR